MNMALWHALSALALHHGRRVSPRDFAAQSAHEGSKPPVLEVTALVLKKFGFDVSIWQGKLSELSANFLPVLVPLKEGAAALWLKSEKDTHSVQVFAGDKASAAVWQTEELMRRASGEVLLAKPNALLDAQSEARSADLEVNKADSQSHWFWSVFKILKRYYGDCMLAALLINLLALATSMFSMNVYDRIVPNAAIHSLWVLAIGVVIAGLIELALRTLRAYTLDVAGKKADLVLSAKIFAKTMNLKSKDHPASSGQYAGQVREFESVRDFVSSSTMVMLTDLPFAILFFAVIAAIGGPIVWVPVVAGILVVLAGVVSQIPIQESVERYQYENSQKLAYMVEAIERIETVQALGAQPTIQSRWERLCAVTSRSAMTSRFVSALMMNFAQTIQQLAGTAMIVMGVYLIVDGKLTVGALIACGILGGRALAPLSQVVGLMMRWHQAKTAFKQLDKIMYLDDLVDAKKTYIQMPRTEGRLTLQDVQFNYPKSDVSVLDIGRLSLVSSEMVAVMGPVGSGKTTLLKVLAGLQAPSKGRMLLDDIDQQHLSPGDWRAQVAWVGQDAILFRGSLRDNLLIASPRVSEEKLIRILKLTGVYGLASLHPQGLDMPIGESGRGISGGQRQMVALARALLSDAKIILMDEPTSAFDGPGEAALLEALKPELQGRTVVIATHRPGPLAMVSRLVILDGGKVIADGPRDVVLQAVKEGSVRRAKVPAPAEGGLT
jgi:ATP-binding cassette, subfamily C, bacterial LapB